MFSINFNGYTIDNNSGQDSGVSVKSIEGLYSVDIRTDQEVNTFADGNKIYTQKYDGRVINVTGLVWGRTQELFDQEVSEFISSFRLTDTELPLSITNAIGTTKVIDARLTRMPNIEISDLSYKTGTFSLTFSAENAYFRDPAVTSVTVGLPVFGGTPVPSPVDSPIGISSGGTVNINYTGTENTYPIFNIRGRAVNPEVRNVTTSKFFSYSDTVLVGEILTAQNLDSGFSYTKNNTNVFSDISGNLFQLQQGNNTISFSASEYADTAELEIIYNVLSLTF